MLTQIKFKFLLIHAGIDFLKYQIVFLTKLKHFSEHD